MSSTTRTTARPDCPHCGAALDEGPVLYRCAPCQRYVYAADLDTEFHVRNPLPA